MYKKLKIGEKLQNIDVCHKTVCWNTMYIEIMSVIILAYRNQILFKYLYISQLVCWNISVTNYCILKYLYIIQMCIFCPTSPVKSCFVIMKQWLSNLSTYFSVFDPRTGRKWRRPLWSQWPSSSLMTCGTFVTEKTSKTSATEFVFVFLCCRSESSLLIFSRNLQLQKTKILQLCSWLFPNSF